MSPIPHAPMTSRAGLADVCVRDLMTPDPVSVRHGITVREAAFLADRGIGAAPVVNDAGRAVGVLSRSDVLLAVMAGVDEAPVREVMSPAVIAVQPDADARQAAVLMVRCDGPAGLRRGRARASPSESSARPTCSAPQGSLERADGR